MAHSETAFIGSYPGTAEASLDYEAVAAAHAAGNLGHLEAAVVARADDGALALDRHERMGGIHLTHGPTDELLMLAEEVEQGSTALLVISAADDAAGVEAAVTRATARSAHPVQHFGLAEGGFAGGGTPDRTFHDTGTGFEGGQVGELGV